MNEISILIVVAAVLLLGLLIVQGISAIIYANSDECRLLQRIRRYTQHEAE